MCFKKGFINLRAHIYLFIRNVQSFELHNVAKHVEFYLRELRFNLASICNAGCSKTLQWYSKCYRVTSVTETFTRTLRGVQNIHRSIS
jgi:hypothetical protein